MTYHPVIWHEHRIPPDRRWTEQDDMRLCVMSKLGVPVPRAARSLNRTISAVRWRRWHLGLTKASQATTNKETQT